MPCLPSVSTRSAERPSAASASASAPATVVLPVPPFPVTTWRRGGGGSELTCTSLGAGTVSCASVLPHERTGPAAVGVRHHPAADPQHQGHPRLLGSRRVGTGDGAARPHRRRPARRVPQAPGMTSGPDAPAQGWHARLAELGIRLPSVAAPVASYVPAVRSGSLVFTSGQLPFVDGGLRRTGKVGGSVDAEAAAADAKVCALNALAAIDDLVGLDSVTRIVKVVGYVASAEGFSGQPRVINGASELLGKIFGSAGQHARSAVGVAELPLGAPVEVELTVELR